MTLQRTVVNVNGETMEVTMPLAEMHIGGYTGISVPCRIDINGNTYRPWLNVTAVHGKRFWCGDESAWYKLADALSDKVTVQSLTNGRESSKLIDINVVISGSCVETRYEVSVRAI